MHLFKLRLPTLITAVIALALLAVAIDWNATPGVAEADHEIAKPGKPAASSSDGAMTVTWASPHGATSGYQYRYSTSATCLLTDGTAGCDDAVFQDWDDHGTDEDDISITFSEATSNALEYGHTYFFQVRGRAGDARGEASDPSDGAFHAAPVPGKLQNVAAAAGNAQVTLSWDDPNDDTIVNYEYRIDPDPVAGTSGWTLWQNFTSSTNSHTVTGLTNGTIYSFQVRAGNSGGVGPESDTVEATPSGPPAAPGDLRATPLNVSVRLHWNDPNDSNIDRYQVRYKSDGDFNSWAEIPNSGATTTEYTVTSLSNSIEYTFEVRAIDSDRADGDQAGLASSATATPTNAARTPSQMSNVKHTVTGVTNGGGGTVTFTWNDPAEDFITKYQYRYDSAYSNPGEGNWDQDWIDAPGDDSNNKDMVTFSRSIPGSDAIVFFELRAINGTPTEPLNGPATAITVERTNTTDTSPAPPAAPTGFSAATEWDDTNSHWDIVLSWTDPSDTDINKYQYRQSTDGGSNWNPDWTDIDLSDASTISHRIDDVTASTTYTFQIRAVDTDLAGDSGNGASSGAETTTPGAPNAPTGLSATPTDDANTDVNEAETQIVFPGQPVQASPA